MNPMQQMMQQAQRMQRELAKAHAAVDAEVFTVKKAGIVEVEVQGTREIISINIDEAAINPDDKDMIEETLMMALNEALAQVKAAHDAVDERITGQAKGF